MTRSFRDVCVIAFGASLIVWGIFPLYLSFFGRGIYSYLPFMMGMGGVCFGIAVLLAYRFKEIFARPALIFYGMAAIFLWEGSVALMIINGDRSYPSFWNVLH